MQNPKIIMRQTLFSIFISLIPLSIYFIIFFIPDAVSYELLQLRWPLVVYITLAVCLVALAYFIDKNGESSPNDDFKNDNLFYRYGNEIYTEIIPLGYDKNANLQNPSQLQSELSNYLADSLKRQYSAMSSYHQTELKITDLKLKKDERTFIRATFNTTRKSTLTYFLHINLIGHQLMIHHYMYLRGHHKWYNALSFIVWAPIHLFFWYGRWVRGGYSIQNRLNKSYNQSSFETINLKSILRSIIFNVMTNTQKFAKQKGLLSEVLEKIIFNQISNSQNINISNSNNLSLGNITSNLTPK